MSIETFLGQNRNFEPPSFDSAQKVDFLGPKSVLSIKSVDQESKLQRQVLTIEHPVIAETAQKFPTKLRGTSKYPLKVLETFRLASES